MKTLGSVTADNVIAPGVKRARHVEMTTELEAK